MTIQGVIAESGLIAPVARYRTGAAQFNGSTILDLGTGLTGVAAAPGFLCSVWLYIASLADVLSTPSVVYQIQEDVISAPFQLTLFADGSLCRPYGEFHSAYFGGGFQLNAQPDAGTSLDFARWVHVACAADTDFAAGLKIRRLSVDGVVLDGSGYDADPAFDIGYTNPSPVNSIHVGQGFTGAMADLQLWPAFHDIADPAVLAVLRTTGGKPTDPALASAAFGVPPLRFSGSGPAFVNHGPDTFSVTGGPLTIAASSPSD